MRALWLVRDNLTRHPGGDTTQVLQTAAALRQLGVMVDVQHGPRSSFGGYDVVHLFHVDRVWENEAYCRLLRRERRPGALSTIWWPADEFDAGGRAGWQGRLARWTGSRRYQDLRLLQRWLLQLGQQPGRHALAARCWGFHRAVRRILATVRVILPNSDAERRELEAHFQTPRPTVVVSNAADRRYFHPPAEDEWSVRRGVYCVGRIEPRKNQLALIEALRGTDIPLVLIGQPGRFSRDYADRCRAAATANMTFLPQQTPDQLREHYHAARVHACVSWYETPGLASLEAGLCGCALVVTPGGATGEYFGGQAHFCNPADPDSIRAAIERALAAPRPAALQARIAECYTWEAAAAQTLRAYELALS
jgi:glycosyltransferase involved in cell wall biosynthesis